MKKKIYRTNRGTPIDFEALKMRNEKVIAAGNVAMNARGDLLKRGGKIEKTAAEIARETAKEAPTVTQKGVSLKAKVKEDSPKENKPAEKQVVKKNEKLLDNGDIVIEDKEKKDKDGN